jgi:antigen flippase
VNLIDAIAARIRWIGSARTSAAAVAYSLVSRLSIMMVNVATGIIVARTLGPAGRGAVAAIVLWPIIVSGVLTLGVPAALRYTIRRRLADTAELFSTAVLIGAVLGAVAFVVGFALVPHILVRYPPAVIVFAQWMMLFAPLCLLNASLQAFYDAQGDFKRSNIMNYVPPMLTLTGLVVLHVLNQTSPFSVSLAYESPFALTTATTLFALRRFLCVPRQIAERVRALLHYGFRAYGLDILGTLAGQIDQAMVIGLLSAGNFGLYAVAVNGSRVLATLAASLNTVLFPTAAGLESSQAVALVVRSARIVFATTAVAASFFVVALPLLVSVAYGEEYASVVGVTRWLSIAVIFAATTTTFTQAFMATGQPGIATILQCLGIGMTVPLMLALIPRFGLTGAAYAVDISSVARFVLVMVSYPLFLHHPVPRLFLTRRDVAALFASLRRARAA